MNELKIFLFGFALYYLISVADLLFQLFTSFVSIYISKCNVIINELSASSGECDDNYRIGFLAPDHEECEYDDYEDNANKKNLGGNKLYD